MTLVSHDARVVSVRASGLARPGVRRWYMPMYADKCTEAALGRFIDCEVNAQDCRVAARRNGDGPPRGQSRQTICGEFTECDNWTRVHPGAGAPARLR